MQKLGQVGNEAPETKEAQGDKGRQKLHFVHFGDGKGAGVGRCCFPCFWGGTAGYGVARLR